MNRWADNFFDWIIEVPSWLRSVVAIVIAAAGLGVCVFAGRIGMPEGGKFGGAVIGIGVALFAFDLFIE
jgi:multisubunit Na+/H+ antiporter MnhB subunit